jgi:ABC-type nitrate/sulfonate/bicarbonate transport system substrate-binding protein
MAIFITLIVLSLANASYGQEKARFPISVASKTVGFVPVWAAWKMGFFEREGLTVDLVLMRGAEKAAMALVGDSVNVAVGSADAFIAAVESNFNVAIVAGIIIGLQYSRFVPRGYSRLPSLCICCESRVGRKESLTADPVPEGDDPGNALALRKPRHRG